jgi:hypothetical protein
MKIGNYDYDLSIDTGSSDIFIKGESSAGLPLNRYKCGSTCLEEN